MTKSYLDSPLRQVNELCLKCGLCCVVLQASCSREEAERVCPQQPERFARPSDRLAENKLLISFPCMFLKGRVMHAVCCSAYEKGRPKVCESYLCRIAVRYRQYEIELEEAEQLLQQAYLSRDVTIFNWGAAEDGPLSIRYAAWELADKLRKEGCSGDIIDYRLSQYLSPQYDFCSLPDRDLFFYHFVCFDDWVKLGKNDLSQAIEKTMYLFYGDEAEEMTWEQKVIKSEAIWKVLWDLRSHLNLVTDSPA